MSFWTRLFEIRDRLSETDYYELLGVAKDAPSAAIVERYYKLTEKIHPDRFSRERDPERQQALVLVFARLGEAFSILKNETKRREYDAQLGGGSTRFESSAPSRSRGPDPVSAVARGLYDKGMALLSSGNTARARAQLELAKQFEPTSQAIASALARCTAPAEPESAPASDDKPETPARRHPRMQAEFSVQLRLQTGAQLKTFMSRDISRGGMFLRIGRELAVGTPVQLKVELPDKTMLAVHAVVVRAANQGDRGVGLRFLELPESERATLEAQLAKLQDDKVAPPPGGREVPFDVLAKRLAHIRELEPSAVLGVSRGAAANEIESQAARLLGKLEDLGQRTTQARSREVLVQIRAHIEAARELLLSELEPPRSPLPDLSIRQATSTPTEARPDQIDLPTQSLFSSDRFDESQAKELASVDSEGAKQARAGMSMLAGKRYQQARETLALAIEQLSYDPRLMAAWHVATGHELLGGGHEEQAADQFRAALEHFRQCEEAILALRALGRQ